MTVQSCLGLFTIEQDSTKKYAMASVLFVEDVLNVVGDI